MVSRYTEKPSSNTIMRGGGFFKGGLDRNNKGNLTKIYNKYRDIKKSEK
jgi:hypothetical protein